MRGWLFGALRIRAVRGFLLVLAVAPFLSLGARAQPLTISVVPEAGERRLFDYQREACEAWDVPDTPIRAYRDADGMTVVFQTHFHNRRAVGQDLFSLKHLCNVVFQGRESRNPADFDDRGWIAATHTSDGKIVHGIVHNEFQGHRRPDLCPSRIYLECWYNTLTAVVSHDGGARFSPATPRLVAAYPLPADQTRGGHAGYFEPSNIVAHDGALFFTANVFGPSPQAAGNCLLRTDNIADSTAWRLWRNHGFTTQIGDPYRAALDPAEHLCDPIDKSALPWPIRGLVRHVASGYWIATMLGGRPQSDGIRRTGVFYSISKDLISWRGPFFLFAAPTDKRACNSDHVIAYPAIIDPRSESRNFDTVSNEAELTYVHIALKDCRTTTTRNIVSRKIILNANVAVGP
jgi:hypothetical protein